MRRMLVFMILTMLICLMVACSDADRKDQIGVDIALEEMRQAVVEALGDNYWPNATIPADALDRVYGIEPDMYEEVLAEMPMITTNVDTLILVRAKEDEINDVEEELNEYRRESIESMTHSPMNADKARASRIETFGNIVCFVQLGGDTTEAFEKGNNAVVEHCQQENEKALDAIGKILGGR